MRRLLAGLAAPALLIASLAVANAGEAGFEEPRPPPRRRRSVSVTPIRTSQSAILAASAFKVRVRVKLPGSCRCRSQSRDRRVASCPDRQAAAPALHNGALAIRFAAAERVGARAAFQLPGENAAVQGEAEGRSDRVGRHRAPSDRARAALRRRAGLSRGPQPNGSAGSGSDGNVIPPPQPYTGPPIDTSNADRCDFLDPAVCLQPWPNDYFTVADSDSATGRRVDLDPNSTPANKNGVHIATDELNRNDGFSPGNMIIVHIPGLDNPQALQNTAPATVDHMERYDDPDTPVVVINADTGQRQPIWTEIDYNPLDPAKGHNPNNPSDRGNVNLIIRPAVNFEEGGHYIVALRDLRDDQGNAIQPTNAFKVYRDNLTTTDPAIEDRRTHMEGLFAKLGAAAIQRSSLYLTWDFTVASEQNLSERMLHIRDDAFSQLGDDDLADNTIQGNAPSFTIDGTQTQNFTTTPNIARIVHGTVTVPCYMNTPGCSPDGSTYNYAAGDTDPDRLPTQLPGNTASVSFECIIPHSALDAAGHTPARVSLYGHGLLGSASEVEGGNVEAMAQEHNIIFCATDWYGFAETNIPNVLLILQDVSQFPLLGTRRSRGCSTSSTSAGWRSTRTA